MSGGKDKIDFEAAVLAAVLADMYDDHAVRQCVKSGVTATWFKSGKWRLAWSAAVGLWREAGSLRTVSSDPALLVREAQRLVKVNAEGFDGEELTSADLVALAELPVVPAHVEYYIAQLQGEVILRAMRSAIESSFKESGKVDAEAACNDLVRRLLDILSRYSVAKNETFSELVEKSIEKMRAAHQTYMVEKRYDYVPGLRTPWWIMDKMLNGLEPGFHIIGARTSVGKTSFALQLARYWAEHGFHVGFDSLDMSSGMFVGRFISERSRVSLFKANFGHTGEDDMARLEGAAEALKAWPIDVVVEYDVDRLFNWCRVRKSAGMLDVLFVDFVQLLMYHGSDRATDTGRMTRVSKTIKRIVNELDIPVIGLSQLNRDCERDGGREPMKADLRESGALEQDATTVMLLYHDKGTVEKWKTDIDTDGSALRRLANDNRYLAGNMKPVFLKIDKNQNGGLGKIPFVVFQNYFTWMLGDYEAPPLKKTVGTGVTQHEEADWSPAFSRVHADWRHSDFENDLRNRFVLLPEDLPPSPQAESNAAAEAERAAAPVPVQTTFDVACLNDLDIGENEPGDDYE